MKTFFIISFVLLSFTINAQIVNIPDPNFKEALLNHEGFGGLIIDTNGDGEIQISEAEAITELIIGDPWVSYNIQDLTGIEAFVNIIFLNCQNNQLTSLNFSENILLEKLYCYDNSLVSIDVTQNLQLKDIAVDSNYLTTINLTQNSQLKHIVANNNYLTTINLTQNSQLIGLDIRNNQFSSLDLSSHIFLRYLACQNNNLTFLDVRNGNNENFTHYNSEDNPDLTCIFVDNAGYSETNWTNIDAASTFVETQEECDVLGIGSIFLEETVVFPNPAKNILHIELPKNSFENLKVKIIDVSGKEVYQTAIDASNFQIDIAVLEEGIYFITIYNDKARLLTKKLIKL